MVLPADTPVEPLHVQRTTVSDRAPTVAHSFIVGALPLVVVLALSYPVALTAVLTGALVATVAVESVHRR
ncbi:hypothetical protein [Salinigranum halophilum]|jgi:hypothetical protein|uniref:hypothetical protein n=1 Tax=Salinigranum halophilum TaxID=2565931 RepID=UPI00115DB303|nr:hypothetical protein [Salinigranum halophilum]